MNKQDVIIILGTAHRMREPGKQSPDGKLRECLYSREICSGIESTLKLHNYNVCIDMPETDLPKNQQSSSTSTERNRELSIRVNFVNELCKKYGAKNVLYVSIHVNAAGADNQWHSANGWQVCVGTNASNNSKTLANSLFDATALKSIKTRKPTALQKYWEQNLYVLNNTKCPAVLTENLFQDNKIDVDYLLSSIGKQNIVNLHVEGIVNYINRL